MKRLSETEIRKLREKGIVIKKNECIGGGAMGEVYAIDTYNGKTDLCIKFIRKAKEENIQKEYERFQNLCRDLSEWVAAVYDLVWIEVPDTDDPDKTVRCAAIVMEKLLKVIRVDNSLRTLVKILYDVSIGLGILHGNRLVHRDVKLENIMFCRRIGRYVLIDLGIAAAADGIIYDGVFMGSRPTIAPESLLTGEYSKRSDFYGLGMSVRELIVGREIHERDRLALYEEKKNLRPLTVKDYNCPELIRIINKLTEFEAERRYDDFTSVINDLKELIRKKGLNIQAPDVGGPDDVYVIAVSQNAAALDIHKVREIVEAGLAKYRINRDIVNVFSFSEKVTVRPSGSILGEDCIEILFAGEKSELCDSLLDRVRDICEDCGDAARPEVHVCIIGAVPESGPSGWLRSFIRNFNKSSSAPVIAYRMGYSNEFMFEVSNYGISEITVVSNAAQLSACFDGWFGTGGKG